MKSRQNCEFFFLRKIKRKLIFLVHLIQFYLFYLFFEERILPIIKLSLLVNVTNYDHETIKPKFSLSTIETMEKILNFQLCLVY